MQASTSPATTTAPVAWLVDFILLAAIWGSSFMFMRFGALEFGAVPIAALRVAIAAVMLAPLLVLRGHVPALRQHWKLTFGVGILNSAIPFVCFSYALQSISTGLSAIINATVPMFGAVIAWAWLKDRPTRSRSLGLLIGFAGVAMLAWDKASFKPDANGVTTGWAVLAVLLACLCYGISASIAKRYMGGIPSLVSATGSQIGATLALTPLALAQWPTHMPGLRAWGAALMLGVVCTGIAYVVFFRLIERAGPAKALSVTFAIPLFAVLYGVLLLGEQVTLWMLLCAAVIVLGTALSTGLLQLSKKSTLVTSGRMSTRA